MRIAFCTGWNVEHDGIADYSRHLVEGLRGQGVEVEIARLLQYRGEREFYRKLAEQANSCDLCHVQYNYVYFNGDLPYRNRFNYFARLLKVPLAVTVHEVRIGYSSQNGSGIKASIFNATLPLWYQWSRSYHRQAYERMDRILVHTRDQAKRIAAVSGCADKITLLPHGVPEPDASYAGIDHEAAKKEFGLRGRKVLGIFGFINKRKGYETALEALSRLDDDVVLLIAGGPMTDNAVDREYYRSLTSLIGQKGLTDRVRITGYLSEEKIPLAMKSVDVCLAPFDSEAASGALSLCLSYAKPIIASDIPVNQEINDRIACLELFARSDAAGLQESVRRCLSDEDRRIQLQSAAAQYARQYGFYSAARKLHEIYQTLLEKKNRGVNVIT